MFSMKNKKKTGVVLLVLGFIILVVNAVDYLSGFFGLSLEVKLPSSAIAIVFVVIGMALSKKK